MHCPWRAAFAGAFVLLIHSLAVADDLEHSPRQLLLTGKYAEAAEAYGKLPSAHSIEAAIGRARSMVATGKRDAAAELLRATQIAHPKNSRLTAELARLCFERGDYTVAASQIDLALEADQNQPLARWVQAELHRTAGRLQEADAAYKWFIDYYNKHVQIDNPETLRLAGLATAQYARWKRLPDQYSFLVRELYPEALKLEKNYWPAHYEAGLIYLEKFNQADAASEFNKALAINPNAAEVHAALAALAIQNYDLPQAARSLDRALSINPELRWARQLQADVELSQFNVRKAIEILGEDRKLNPHDEQRLGRLVAAYIARDGMHSIAVGNALGGVSGPPNDHVSSLRPTEWRRSRSLESLVEEVNARNPHAGEFYTAAGDALDKLRRYPAAAHFYQHAIDRMPQLVAPYGQLGLIQMRLGDEAAAEKTLKRAFEIDSFNVRVRNSLEVLEVLKSYTTLQTDHFVIKFDRGHDEVLARTAAHYLEEDVYPTITKRLGHEPKGKTLIELFSRAKNTDGHGWFSARMIGLPYVGTVGACAGRVVAMHSPTDANMPFNWARVLRHEFVHAVNLDQTDFAIPHWFTEALAIHHEDLPRPPEWNTLLLAAVKGDSLLNLQSINGGFIRPKSRDQWGLAYCQAEAYAEYMLSAYGPDALTRMLLAFADGLPTAAAIERSFGVDQDAFEHGYRKHIARVCDEIQAQRAALRTSLTQWKTEAREYLRSGDDERLAEVLPKLANIERDNVLIRMKLAILAYQREDWPQATRWATEAVHIDVNDGEMHRIRGEAAAAEKQHVKAIEHFHLALHLDKHDVLARIGLIKSQHASSLTAEATQEFESLKTLAPGHPSIADLRRLFDQ